MLQFGQQSGPLLRTESVDDAIASLFPDAPVFQEGVTQPAASSLALSTMNHCVQLQAGVQAAGYSHVNNDAHGNSLGYVHAPAYAPTFFDGSHMPAGNSIMHANSSGQQAQPKLEGLEILSREHAGLACVAALKSTNFASSLHMAPIHPNSSGSGLQHPSSLRLSFAAGGSSQIPPETYPGGQATAMVQGGDYFSSFPAGGISHVELDTYSGGGQATAMVKVEDSFSSFAAGGSSHRRPDTYSVGGQATAMANGVDSFPSDTAGGSSHVQPDTYPGGQATTMGQGGDSFASFAAGGSSHVRPDTYPAGQATTVGNGGESFSRAPSGSFSRAPSGSISRVPSSNCSISRVPSGSFSRVPSGYSAALSGKASTGVPICGSGSFPVANNFVTRTPSGGYACVGSSAVISRTSSTAASHASMSECDAMEGYGTSVPGGAGCGDKRLRKTTSKRRPWTADEHERFLDSLKRFGSRDRADVGGRVTVGLGAGVAEVIAVVVGTRTVSQVRSHAQKYFLQLSRAASAASAALQQQKGKPSTDSPTASALPPSCTPALPSGDLPLFAPTAQVPVPTSTDPLATT